MYTDELRIKCLEMAILSDAPYVVAAAQEYFDFVTNGAEIIRPTSNNDTKVE